MTSAIIVYDYYNQIKAYEECNKDALVPIIGDSIQLSVGAAVFKIEIGEGLGLTVFEGLSAAAGPIGMAVLPRWEKFEQGILCLSWSVTVRIYREESRK